MKIAFLVNDLQLSGGGGVVVQHARQLSTIDGWDVTFITEARWIRDTLAGLRPDAPCYLVRNGIDKDVFAPLEYPPINTEGPLRVLIEGSPTSWFKHVHEAINAASAMREPHHVTVV